MRQTASRQRETGIYWKTNYCSVDCRCTAIYLNYYTCIEQKYKFSLYLFDRKRILICFYIFLTILESILVARLRKVSISLNDKERASRIPVVFTQ